MGTRPTNGQLVMTLGAGHTAWGLVAHRRALSAIVSDGVFGTVGDGLFVHDHARDDRAAAFWFVLIGPLLMTTGRLVHDAESRGDEASVRRASRAGLAVAVLGACVVPRSGFPAGIAVTLRGAGTLRARTGTGGSVSG